MTAGSSLTKATIIDGVAATEDRDSQGEILKLDGVNIDQMTQKGFLNDNHGTGFLNTLGRITEAKKIFKQEDCTSARQSFFWKQKQRPFLYVKGYLFDEEDHPNAKAVAAVMRGFQKMGTPMDVKMSVEGKVLDRAPGGLIRSSMVRNVALTLIPANGETAASIAGTTIQKSLLAEVQASGGNVEYADALIKSMSVASPAHRWEEPSIAEMGVRLKQKLTKVRDLIKMLAPASGSGSPSTRTGMAALQSESLDGKIQAAHKKERVKKLAKSLIQENPKMPVAEAVRIAFEQIKV